MCHPSSACRLPGSCLHAASPPRWLAPARVGPRRTNLGRNRRTHARARRRSPTSAIDTNLRAHSRTSNRPAPSLPKHARVAPRSAQAARAGYPVAPEGAAHQRALRRLSPAQDARPTPLRARYPCRELRPRTRWKRNRVTPELTEARLKPAARTDGPSYEPGYLRLLGTLASAIRLGTRAGEGRHALSSHPRLLSPAGMGRPLTGQHLTHRRRQPHHAHQQ